MGPAAVILNDTRRRRHFGCARVMRVIEENLVRRGIVVTARSLAGHAWRNDRAFLEALSGCSVVVINGEGTLHHGAPLGREILAVAEHPARGTTPIALLNALYQENPVEWRRFLDAIDLVVARDSWSAAEIRRVSGRSVEVVADLSMAEPPPCGTAGAEPRDRVYVGDSVLPATRSLLSSAAGGGGRIGILPILVSRHALRPELPAAARRVREAWNHLRDAVSRLGEPATIRCVDEGDYLGRIRRARLHVTGRFHAVCLSLVTRTPFLAVASNSWKIEALLHDFGLGRGRMIGGDRVADALADPEAFAFTAGEEALIGAALDRCAAGAARTFDEVDRLARGCPAAAKRAA